MDFFIALAHECARNYGVSLDKIYQEIPETGAGNDPGNVFIWFPKHETLHLYSGYVFAVFDTSCKDRVDSCFESIKSRIIFSKFMPHSNAHDRWFVALKPLCEARP